MSKLFLTIAAAALIATTATASCEGLLGCGGDDAPHMVWYKQRMAQEGIALEEIDEMEEQFNEFLRPRRPDVTIEPIIGKTQPIYVEMSEQPQLLEEEMAVQPEFNEQEHILQSNLSNLEAVREAKLRLTKKITKIKEIKSKMDKFNSLLEEDAQVEQEASARHPLKGRIF